MARKKNNSGPTKTDIVRDYLAGNPTAPASQIVSDLKPYGISRALAAKVKSRYGKKTARKKPGRKPRTTTPAASSAGGSKADAIRKVAKSMPKPFRPRDVRAVLAEQGIHATTTMIGKVLRSMGMKRKRRRRKAAAGGATPAVAANSAALNIDDLVAAKKLVGQVGSIEKVKVALAALARLS